MKSLATISGRIKLYQLRPMANVLMSLPRLVRAPLPALRVLFISRMEDENTEYSRSRKPLIHFPFNVREVGLYQKRFTSIVQLRVFFLQFANFADFARFLGCFDALEELELSNITWNVLGVIPGCMTHKKRPFLPKLQKLDVRDSELPFERSAPILRTH